MSSWNTLELASAARRQQHQREHRDRRRQRPRHRPSTLPAALRAGAWPAGVEVVVGAAKLERFGSPGRSAPEDRRRDVENVAAPAVRAVRAEGHLPKRGPPLENGPPSPSPPIRGEGPLSESTAGGLGTTSTRGAIPRGRGPRGVRAQWSERLAGEVPTRRSLSNSFAMKPKKASARYAERRNEPALRASVAGAEKVRGASRTPSARSWARPGRPVSVATGVWLRVS
jgi:hypothetical protein